jgi:hypothetical protein
MASHPVIDSTYNITKAAPSQLPMRSSANLWQARSELVEDLTISKAPTSAYAQAYHESTHNTPTDQRTTLTAEKPESILHWLPRVVLSRCGYF